MIEQMARSFRRIKRIMLSRHLWFTRSVALALVILVFWGLFVIVRDVLSTTTVGQYALMGQAFLFPSPAVLNTTNDRTNVLLLGVAGDGDKNPFVTDTMILASLDLKTKKIVLVSIPRDIWVPEFEDKINSAYFRGKEKNDAGGLILSKSVVEEVVGIPVHYALAVDFDGFVKVVDLLGGVEINIDRSFSDKLFPILGREEDECGGDPEYLCRYETVSFEAGPEVMNGERALKFSRSRHSEDPEEGTDLARTARQQKVLVGIKNEMLKPRNFLSPVKMIGLWNTFNEITETDLTDPQLAYVARIFVDARDSINSFTVPEDLLFNPPYSDEYRNLYVFVPKTESWSEVHAWVLSVLTD